MLAYYVEKRRDGDGTSYSSITKLIESIKHWFFILNHSKRLNFGEKLAFIMIFLRRYMSQLKSCGDIFT